MAVLLVHFSYTRKPEGMVHHRGGMGVLRKNARTHARALLENMLYLISGEMWRAKKQISAKSGTTIYITIFEGVDAAHAPPPRAHACVCVCVCARVFVFACVFLSVFVCI